MILFLYSEVYSLQMTDTPSYKL